MGRSVYIRLAADSCIVRIGVPIVTLHAKFKKEIG